MASTKPVIKRIVRYGLDIINRQPVARNLLRRLSLFGVVPNALWSRLSPDSDFTILFNESEMRYRCDPGDQIGNELFWRNEFEAATTKIMVDLARNANVMLDIGANSGFYTLLTCLVNEKTSVLAFEPVPHVFEALVRNVEANDWLARCALKRAAVGDRCGTSEFHVPFSGFPSSASLHTGGFRGIEGEKIEVEIVTIDSVCNPQVKVDLVKIDVEGFEHLVIKGMMGTLQRCKPNLIIECNVDGPFREIEILLNQLDYCYYLITNEGLLPLEHIVPDPNEIYRNILCSIDRTAVDVLTPKAL